MKGILRLVTVLVYGLSCGVMGEEEEVKVFPNPMVGGACPGGVCPGVSFRAKGNVNITTKCSSSEVEKPDSDGNVRKIRTSDKTKIYDFDVEVTVSSNINNGGVPEPETVHVVDDGCSCETTDEVPKEDPKGEENLVDEAPKEDPRGESLVDEGDKKEEISKEGEKDVDVAKDGKNVVVGKEEIKDDQAAKEVAGAKKVTREHIEAYNS